MGAANPVMLDWSGDAAKTFTCVPGKANILALDRRGRILHGQANDKAVETWCGFIGERLRPTGPYSYPMTSSASTPRSVIDGSARAPEIPGGGALIQDGGFLRGLNRIVIWLVGNLPSRDDLMQEALFHGWREAERRPGRTTAWYLKSCRFHLQHVLAAGRSIDSPKRRKAAARCRESIEPPVEVLEVADPAADVVGEVCVRELVRILRGRLQPRQGLVLAMLVEGLGPAEVSRNLNISHPAVSKLRRKLATMLTALWPDASLPPAGGRDPDLGRRRSRFVHGTLEAPPQIRRTARSSTNSPKGTGNRRPPVTVHAMPNQVESVPDQRRILMV